MTRQDNEDIVTECESDSEDEIPALPFEGIPEALQSAQTVVHTADSKGIQVGPAFYFFIGQQENLEEAKYLLQTVVKSAVSTTASVVDTTVQVMEKSETSDIIGENRVTHGAKSLLPSETSQPHFAHSSPCLMSSQHPCIVQDGVNSKIYDAGSMTETIKSFDARGCSPNQATGTSFDQDIMFPPSDEPQRVKVTQEHYLIRHDSSLSDRGFDEDNCFTTYPEHNFVQSCPKYTATNSKEPTSSYGIPVNKPNFTNPFIFSCADSSSNDVNTLQREQTLTHTSNKPGQLPISTSHPYDSLPTTSTPHPYHNDPITSNPHPYSNNPTTSTPHPYHNNPITSNPHPYPNNPTTFTPHPYHNDPITSNPHPYPDNPTASTPHPYHNDPITSTPHSYHNDPVTSNPHPYPNNPTNSTPHPYHSDPTISTPHPYYKGSATSTSHPYHNDLKQSNSHPYYSSATIQSERIATSSPKIPLSTPVSYKHQPSPFTFQQSQEWSKYSSSPEIHLREWLKYSTSPELYSRQWSRYSTSPERHFADEERRSIEYELNNQLQRVKIADREPRAGWTAMERPFVESGGFRLGIPSGKFYKTPHGIFVEMTNGTRYTIVVGSSLSVRCNVNLFVDDKLVLLTQLSAKGMLEVDGPQNSQMRFAFFRAKDAPRETGIRPDFEGNGVIKAVFQPEVATNFDPEERRGSLDSTESARSFSRIMEKTLRYTRSDAELPLLGGGEYRSVDPTNLCTGATALQGRKRAQTVEKADDILVDRTREVILQLRLLARQDGPNTPSTNEEICPLTSMRPPKIEDMFK